MRAQTPIDVSSLLGPPKGKVVSVLFVGPANASRTLMAEAILNRLGAGRFCGYSAGIAPCRQPHPYTLELLAGPRYNSQRLRPQHWEEFTAPEAPEMDFVVTLGRRAAREVPPLWPGTPRIIEWSLPDPAASSPDKGINRRSFLITYMALFQRLTVLTSLYRSLFERVSPQLQPCWVQAQARRHQEILY